MKAAATLEQRAVLGKLFKQEQGCFTTQLTPSRKPFSVKFCHGTVHVLFHWWGVLGHFLIFENRHWRVGGETITVEWAGILTMLKFSLCFFSLTTLDYTCKRSKRSLKREEVKTYIKSKHVFYFFFWREKWWLNNPNSALSILDHDARKSSEIRLIWVHILVQLKSWLQTS